MYQFLFGFLKKYISADKLFKYGFNWSPMYRRSTGRVRSVSKDLLSVRVEIPLTYKNRNYVGTMFGGSLYSAVDPIYMIQLIQILGNDYVVWDKSATIRFKRPARSKAIAKFEFSQQEIEDIKKEIHKSEKMDLIKKLNIVSESGEVFAEVDKTIFVSTKAYYRARKAAKK